MTARNSRTERRGREPQDRTGARTGPYLPTAAMNPVATAQDADDRDEARAWCRPRAGPGRRRARAATERRRRGLAPPAAAWTWSTAGRRSSRRRARLPSPGSELLLGVLHDLDRRLPARRSCIPRSRRATGLRSRGTAGRPGRRRGSRRRRVPTARVPRGRRRPAATALGSASAAHDSRGRCQREHPTATGDDAEFLKEMLYEAAAWNPDSRASRRSRPADPVLERFHRDWGRRGDLSVAWRARGAHRRGLVPAVHGRRARAWVHRRDARARHRRRAAPSPGGDRRDPAPA